MKNREIIGAINGLNEFLSKERVLPVKVSYAISKNSKKLMEAYSVYDPERAKIVEGYEEKSEEEKKETDKKLNELLDIDNEDVVLHKVPLEVLETCENMTFNDFKSIEFMIEE